MSYIFISYSKKNADYAHRLADKLRAEGFEVWIDKRRLATGEDWWKAIVLALRSCGAFVVIMTPESDGSRWVQREITLAEKYEKPVFPLWLAGDTNTPNWELFVRTQYEDVRGGLLPGEEFYARLEQYTLRQRGKTVTQEQPIVPAQPVDAELANEIAHPPPATEALSIPAQNPARRTGRLVFAAVVSVIGVALLVFALSQRGQQAALSQAETAADQAVGAVTLEPTSTPTPVETTQTPGQSISTASSVTPSSTPTITAAAQTVALTAQTNSDTALRVVSSSGGIVLSTLRYFSQVILLSRDGEGLQVEVQVSGTDQAGWLMTRALRIAGDVAALPVNDAAPTIQTATVIGTANVNLRSGPGEGYSVRRILEPGTEVIALGRNASAGWLYVDRNTIEGWMSASVLDVQGDELLLPVIKSEGG